MAALRAPPQGCATHTGSRAHGPASRSALAAQCVCVCVRAQGRRADEHKKCPSPQLAFARPPEGHKWPSLAAQHTQAGQPGAHNAHQPACTPPGRSASALVTPNGCRAAGQPDNDKGAPYARAHKRRVTWPCKGVMCRRQYTASQTALPPTLWCHTGLPQQDWAHAGCYRREGWHFGCNAHEKCPGLGSSGSQNFCSTAFIQLFIINSTSISTFIRMNA